MLLGKKMRGRCGGGDDAMGAQTERLSLLERKKNRGKSHGVNLTRKVQQWLEVSVLNNKKGNAFWERVWRFFQRVGECWGPGHRVPCGNLVTLQPNFAAELYPCIPVGEQWKCWGKPASPHGPGVPHVTGGCRTSPSQVWAARKLAWVQCAVHWGEAHIPLPAWLLKSLLNPFKTVGPRQRLLTSPAHQ